MIFYILFIFDIISILINNNYLIYIFYYNYFIYLMNFGFEKPNYLDLLYDYPFSSLLHFLFYFNNMGVMKKESLQKFTIFMVMNYFIFLKMRVYLDKIRHLFKSD